MLHLVLYSNTVSSMELHSLKGETRWLSPEAPDFFWLTQNPFLHQRGSVLDIFPHTGNTVWAALFFTCNHCNTISFFFFFLTQSPPLFWMLHQVTPTQTELSRPALLHSTAQHAHSPPCPSHAAHLHETTSPTANKQEKKQSNKLNLFCSAYNTFIPLRQLHSFRPTTRHQMCRDVLGQVQCAAGQPTRCPCSNTHYKYLSHRSRSLRQARCGGICVSSATHTHTHTCMEFERAGTLSFTASSAQTAMLSASLYCSQMLSLNLTKVARAAATAEWRQP